MVDIRYNSRNTNEKVTNKENMMSEVNIISNNIPQNDTNIKQNKNTNNIKFSSYLGETATLDSIFEKAAKKYKVSENLLKSIGKTESDFNTKAVSRSGAQGVMQLMPATAAELGVTNSFDPEQNIMGGAKYISGLLKRYNGDTKLALAAYNAGSGNVAKYGGIPPFKETQNYVVKVTNFMRQGVNVPNAPVAISRPVEPPNTTAETTSSGETTRTVTPIPTNFINTPTREIDMTKGLNQDLDAIFSYEDYLNFLEKLFFDKSEKDKEEDPSYYASKQINYSIPVINLLKQ